MPTSYVRVALMTVVLVSPVAAASAMHSTTPCMYQGDADKLQAAAAKGDTDAMYKMGCRYMGSGKYNAEAAQWFRKAADGGNTSGMYLLGILHMGNAGVVHDESLAVALFRKAADLGNTSAMFSLGMSYWTGRGVSPDIAEAYKWLNLSATNEQPGEGQKRSADVRDLVAKKISPSALADALKRQQAWQAAFDARKK